MAHFNGARLLSLLSRRSLESNLLKNSAPYTLNNSLHRGFFSGVHKLSLIPDYVNSENEKQRNRVRIGALNGSLGWSRFIHATQSMALPDHYETLGVSKNASSSEIKRAFYELAKKFHPDTTEDDADAVRKFQELQQAYEALKDDSDEQLNNDQEKGPAGGGPGGFDNVVYNNGFASETFDYDNSKEILRKKGLRGEDVKVSLELSFMEAIHGCCKAVSFETAIPCEACGGAGLPRGTKPETCKHCTGSGMILWHWPDGQFEFRYTCTHCWGSGNENFCKSCRGDGVVRGLKAVEVNVEPGTEGGQTLTVHKGGGADPKENRPGDLYITIKVSNSVSPFAGVLRS